MLCLKFVKHKKKTQIKELIKAVLRKTSRGLHKVY